jgi:hypothetical protein
MLGILSLLSRGGGPLGDALRLGGALALLVFFGWWWLEGVKQDAREGAVIEIERSHKRADDAADAVERDLSRCPLGQWSRETQRCETH